MKKTTQDPVRDFNGNAETFAFLQMLTLGDQAVAAGKIRPAADVIARLRTKRFMPR